MMAPSYVVPAEITQREIAIRHVVQNAALELQAILSANGTGHFDPRYFHRSLCKLSDAGSEAIRSIHAPLAEAVLSQNTDTMDC